MKGIIIGAGIGGLTTAIALQKAGIDFEIMEAAPELRPLGAGIVMATNAMQVYQRFGMEKEIMNAGVEVAEGYVIDQSARIISGMKIREKVVPRYGIGSYALHRGRLQHVLLSKISGKTVQLNKRLNGAYQKGKKVIVGFEDGSKAEGDFVIGADGIRSAVRKNILGEVAYRYTGQTCWRGMADFALPEKDLNTSFEMWGNAKGHRFGYVPTGKNEVYYFTTWLAPANGKDDPGTTKSTVLKNFSTFGKLPVTLIEATPEDKIIRSDILDFVPIKQWWKGRVALIGDAAHATTPNLGQGGCQAVEDAWVIADCLKKESEIERAFEQYQSIRFEKANYVVNSSWRFSNLTNVGNPILRSMRNSLLRMIPESTTMKELDKIFRLNY